MPPFFAESLIFYTILFRNPRFIRDPVQKVVFFTRSFYEIRIFACSFVETNFFRDLLTKSVFVRDPRPKVSSFYTILCKSRILYAILCQKTGFLRYPFPKVAFFFLSFFTIFGRFVHFFAIHWHVSISFLWSAWDRWNPCFSPVIWQN